jgi:hypothetical protein
VRRNQGEIEMVLLEMITVGTASDGWVKKEGRMIEFEEAYISTSLAASQQPRVMLLPRPALHNIWAVCIHMPIIV